MNFFVIAAISFTIFLGFLFSGKFESNETLNAKSVRVQELAAVDAYRTFLQAADAYMKGSLPAVVVPTRVYWADIKSAVNAPPSLALVEMPADWMIVRSPDSSWVACTRMEPGSMNSITNAPVAEPSQDRRAGVLQTSNTIAIPQTMVSVDAVGLTATAAIVGVAAAPTHMVLGDGAAALSLALLCN